MILGYLDAYDPDIIVQFCRDVPGFVRDLGLRIIKPGDVWGSLGNRRHPSPDVGIGIFELCNEIYERHFRYKEKYPIKVVAPKVPTRFPLFWASMFGEFPSAVMPSLKEQYFEPLEVAEPVVSTERLDQLLDGRVLFPRRMTAYGLNAFSRSGFGRDALVYFLDATKVEDVVDLWNLRALGKNVLGVPKQFSGDPHLKEFVVTFLRSNRRPWRHDSKSCDFASFVRARGVKMEEMESYAEGLRIEPDPGDPSDDPFFALQRWYPRIWDEWARDKDGAVPDDVYGDEEDTLDIADTNDARIRIRPLVPKFAERYGQGHPRCANEFSFRFYGSHQYLAEVFPKFPGKRLASVIGGATSLRGAWRVGRNGLVKLVGHHWSETRDIPTGESLFFAWLADLGWSAELSPPGILAKQVYAKLEGYPGFLRNEKLLGLLEHMNGGLVKQDGSPAKENRIGQERELAVGEVKNRLAGSSPREDLHDYLVSRGVFKLGLRVKCPHCLRNSWFSLGAIQNALDCPRCLNSFPAIGNVDSGTWYYKTAGPFSIPNYADGAYAVLLALDFFGDRKLNTLRTTPALSFKAQAQKRTGLEADFALFWQESLYGEKKDGLLFGECKTYGEFDGNDFDRVRSIAKAFPGALLVFSTLRKALTAKEVAGITSIAKAGRKYSKHERSINPVLVLTGTELLGWEGPPQCWEESLQKKFDHLSGLLSVCDATQQIYLGLPSWRTEWREKWERRRTRRIARKSA